MKVEDKEDSEQSDKDAEDNQELAGGLRDMSALHGRVIDKGGEHGKDRHCQGCSQEIAQIAPQIMQQIFCAELLLFFWTSNERQIITVVCLCRMWLFL